MLAQEIIRQYGGRVAFHVEDLGASKIAERFGVDKYPAIFVDNALVARPEDFYAWGKAPAGKYLPWNELESRRRFQADLKKMIDIRLTGGRIASLLVSPGGSGLDSLPDVALTALDGANFRFADMRGRPVIVEFWAPWCPHCIDTLNWMKKLDRSRVGIVAVAIDAPAADIASATTELQIPGRVTIATNAVRDAFGGPPAVPTLLVADRNGKIVKIFYGASPTLHDDIAKLLKAL